MSEKETKKVNTISLLIGALTAWVILVGIYVLVGSFSIYLVKGTNFWNTLTDYDNITVFAVMALLMTLIPLFVSLIRGMWNKGEETKKQEGMTAMY
jgi:H+/Cl- antiporter ClcA